MGSLTNEGYWGVPVQAGRHYALSMRLASTEKADFLHPPHPCWDDCSISACKMLLQHPMVFNVCSAGAGNPSCRETYHSYTISGVLAESVTCRQKEQNMSCSTTSSIM